MLSCARFESLVQSGVKWSYQLRLLEDDMQVTFHVGVDGWFSCTVLLALTCSLLLIFMWCAFHCVSVLLASAVS